MAGPSSAATWAPPRRMCPRPPPPPSPSTPGRARSWRLAASSQCHGRRGGCERSCQIPAGRGRPAPGGVEKVNLKVKPIVMQKRLRFCARRAPGLARRARAAPRARWRGCPPGASNGPGRRAEPRLQDAPEPLARQDAGSQQQPGKLRCSPTLPRNGSPRRNESARERCCQAERGTERGRASNNHLLPLSAIQGRNKTALSIPWESSPELRKAGLKEKALKPPPPTCLVFYFFFLFLFPRG